jgi:hypothetical protein
MVANEQPGLIGAEKQWKAAVGRDGERRRFQAFAVRAAR